MPNQHKHLNEHSVAILHDVTSVGNMMKCLQLRDHLYFGKYYDWYWFCSCRGVVPPRNPVFIVIQERLQALLLTTT